jgi:oxygen-independent coproporphyrinogen-3 oxidase
MFEATGELLGKAGYRHYEISNFARPGRQARHNGSYWNRTSYLGFGAGAHSFWNGDGFGERWCNAEDFGEYREAITGGSIPQREHEFLTLDQAVSESFFLGLRVLGGLDLARLESRYGRAALQTRLAEVALLQASGTLIREGDLLRLAPQAVILANGVFSRFL